MSEYELSSDPNNCVGFTQVFPNKIKELERQRASRNPEPKEREQLFTRAECALFLCLSKSTLDRMVKSEKIPHIRIGSRIVFSRVSLLKWLRAKESLPLDFIEKLLEREQLLIVEKRQARIREVAGNIGKILKMQMDEKYWWQTLNSKKREEFIALEKKLVDELELFNYEERERKKIEDK